MTITELLLLTHLVSTAGLLAVLWLVILVQSVCRLAAGLGRPSARLVSPRAAVTAAVRFPEADRGRPLQSPT